MGLRNIPLNDFIPRVLTGIIFVLAIVSAVWFGPVSYVVLFTVITGLALYEYYRLVCRAERGSFEYLSGVVAGAYLFAASYLFRISGAGVYLFAPYVLYLVFLFVRQLYIKDEDALQSWAYILLGQVYIAFFFSSVNFICIEHDPAGNLLYKREYLLALLFFIWLYDSAAYVFGVLFGKHRLFERISPNKSWEGAIGGGIVVLISSYGCALLFPSLTFLQWLAFAAIVVVFGTWGDLTESLMKRNLNTKDSGNLLPGHGGLLDRFDSFLLSAPAIWAYLEIFIRN